MKNYKILLMSAAIATFAISCDKDDNTTASTTTSSSTTSAATTVDFSGTYALVDQSGRPAVNTVFSSADKKDGFNTTIPSQQGAKYQAMFETNLKALSPAYANAGDKNALGHDAATFTGLLATDVLNVSLDGTTTFYDGTNVLTGRSLADDVITTELLLIFGGEDFKENPQLSDDHVSANDKSFLTSFPYLATPW